MAKKLPTHMLRIEHSKEGRKDGGYTRVLGNEDLGALISRLQSTVISSGNALEAFIYQEIISQDKFIKTISNLTTLDSEINSGINLLSIDHLKEKDFLPKKNNSLKKQDFYIVDYSNNIFYLVELKEGDTFDTKKSSGEWSALNIAEQFYSSRLSNFNIVKIFVSFTSITKQQVFIGAKKIIPLENCMTGHEFCDLLGISFNKIMSEKVNAAKENFDFFKKEILNILNNK